MKLPEDYIESMRQLLGEEELQNYLDCFDAPRTYGLRVNTGKISVETFLKRTPFHLTPVPWVENGFYYDPEEGVTKHPDYYAGLYYIQEPSAMVPASRLPIEEGDRVLDLCAAPGGKSTELAARLRGTGLLVSNDISRSRAQGLLKNLELFGAGNILVTSETPESLLGNFEGFFDKILVDAPCSGEGMFRKDPDLIKSWLERGPEYYAPIQRQILKSAAAMLKPGGMLLYSTCTFAKLEDEDTIQWILEEEPDLELVPIEPWEGACGGFDGMPVIRLFPHKIEGEGHFLALLRKKDTQAPDGGKFSGSIGSDNRSGAASGKDSAQVRRLEQESDFGQWEAMLTQALDHSRIMVRDGMVYYLPKCFDRSWNLRYLRTGLLLGEWKKNRFEPAQALAQAKAQPEGAEASPGDEPEEKAGEGA